jgi:hypothetical protein
MNDTHAQPSADATRPEGQEPAATETPAAPANRPARPARQRVGATLGDAAGAQALRALGRELRQARGETGDADDDTRAAAGDEFTAPGAPRQGRPRRAQPGGGPRAARGNPGPRNARAGRPANKPAESQPPAADAKPARPLHPVLLRLRELYPRLFGEQPLPLKRGIYQDLVAAHPEGELDHAGLKVALGLHTRSYRYLSAVSQGMPRHDLQGQVAEAMAPEHVHHALLEVFRRRKPRDGEDLAQKLRRRIAIAVEASGLTRESYGLLVRGRNAEANAALDDALAEVAERDAKAEALRRTFEASGQSLEDFAQTYGLRPQDVQQALARCAQVARRQTREPAAPAAPDAPAPANAAEGEGAGPEAAPPAGTPQD